MDADTGGGVTTGAGGVAEAAGEERSRTADSLSDVPGGGARCLAGGVIVLLLERLYL